MERTILDIRLDAESDWFAELSCGHCQHTRHNPPLNERPWVQTVEGRESRIGTALHCIRCEHSEIPSGYAPYKRTPTFTDETVPAGLLKGHATRRGVWALIHVVTGELAYFKDAPFNSREIVTPSHPAVVLPELEHHIQCTGPAELFLEFWRPDAADV